MSVRTLVLNGAGAGAGPTNLVALLEDDDILCERKLSGRGASEQFAPVMQALLAQSGWEDGPDLIAAVIGPGSFTGLRASLALAGGLAAGWGCAVSGVTLGEALRATLGRDDVTCVSLARRGRVFVDAPEGTISALPIAALEAAGWDGVAGDALGERESWPCPVFPVSAPDALGIAKAARRRPGRALSPLYIDPPEAKLPAGGLRPAPL